MPCQEGTSIEGKQVLRGVLQNFITYIKHQQCETNVKSSERSVCEHKIVSTTSSVASYISYRKQVDSKLAEINNNISDMLIESFKGIDSICSRVRECVSDFNNQEQRPTTTVKEFRTSTSTITGFDDGTTENLLESVHEESMKSQNKSIDLSHSELASAYTIESVEEDEETTIETSNILEPDILETSEHDLNKNGVSREKSKAFLPNFITVVGDGNVNETDGIIQDRKRIERKLQRRNKQKKLLENLRDSLKDDVYNTDLTSLQALIENVTEQIDVLGSQFMNERPLETKKYAKIIKEKAITKNQKEASQILKTNTELIKDNNNTMTKEKIFQVSEVYHRPAVTNLHKRLLFQLEANDSFVTFQKLMQKNKKNLKCNSPISHINIPILSTTPSNCSQKIIKKNKQSKSSVKNAPEKIKEDDSAKRNLRCKFTDSLWFNDKKNKAAKCTKKKKERPKTPMKPVVGTKAKSRNVAFIQQKVPAKNTSVCSCSVVVTNDSPVPNYVNTRHNWHTSRSHGHGRKLAYLDILDDLTNRDLLPLHSEYPRKDNISSTYFDINKNVHDSYLYKMMYGGTEKHGNIWNHLIRPTIECCDGSCGFCKHDKKKNQTMCAEKSVTTVCTTKEKPMTASDKYKLDKATGVNARRKKVIQTLATHLFDPQEHRKHLQTLVVMPVRVFYDKDQNITKTSLPNVTVYPSKETSLQKLPTVPLPLIPMKEVKVNRAKWINPTNKQNQKILQDSPNYHPDQTKSPDIKYSLKSVTLEHKELSKSPKKEIVSTLSSPQHTAIMENYKRANKNLEKFMQQQKEIKKLTSINSTKTGSNISSNKNEIKKKSNSKTVGQQLVSYLKTQPKKLDKSESSIDKYFNVLLANPKSQNLKVQTQTAKHQASIICNQSPRICNQSTRTKGDIKNSPLSSTAIRHKQMLAHLKGLKHKNDQIQSNIQKAINVIESKMIDILSSADNTTSIVAFDEMEKEITNVLDLMKYRCPSHCTYFQQLTPVKEQSADNSSKSPDDSFVNKDESCQNQSFTESQKREKDIIEEEFNAIADDLYNKLDKILDAGMKKETSASDLDDGNVVEKQNTKIIDLSTNDKRFSSSETTVSTDSLRYKNHTKKVGKCDSSIIDKTYSLTSSQLEKDNTIGENISKTNQVNHCESTDNYDKSQGDYYKEIITEKHENVMKKVEFKDDHVKFQVDPVKVYMHVHSDNPRHVSSLDRQEEKPSLFDEDITLISKDVDKHKQKPSYNEQSCKHENVIQKTKHNNPNGVKSRLKSEECLKPERESIEILDRIKTETEIANSKNNRRTLLKERPKTSPFKKIRYQKLSRKQHVDLSDATAKSEVTATNKSSKENKDDSTTATELTQGIQEINITKKEKPDESSFSETTNKYVDTLEDQVHKIISRVEDIYSQLDEIQTSVSTKNTKEDNQAIPIPVFRDSPPDIHKIPSQEFLTPFMQAVKHSRILVKQLDVSPSPSIERSPSYYNVLSFLDNLYDIPPETATEIQKATEVDYAVTIGTANTVHISSIKHYSYLTNDTCRELIEKPSCLKKYSEDNKSKPKKVSFVVMHQTESIPEKNLPRILSQMPTDNIDASGSSEDISCNVLDRGDNALNTSNIIVICDKRATSTISTFENTSVTNDFSQTNPSLCFNKCTQIEQRYKKTLDKQILVDEEPSTSGESEIASDLTFYTAQSLPKIKVFYNKSKNNLPRLFNDDASLSNCSDRKINWQSKNNSLISTRNPKVIIFREIGEVPELLKRSDTLKRFATSTLIPSTANKLLLESHVFNKDNVVLLQSFYAIMYLIMFTALNLDYKCF